ncbi:glutathione-S-transferase [Epithele typhae]|uniref:glutathione-S-transferase n=1 Tax=Epithele typhae TaxID=378194 RepID=UPI00200897B7|nr:glutathione-S-transferase [Epithele typhae]KAH9942184.1 glutathione-S-transferase [Epithele typhae]
MSTPHPDAGHLPEATGLALKTVQAHVEPQEVTLYAAWWCPYAQRVWITLEERGIPYQYKEVNPYEREPHFMAINPRGLVPAAEYKGQALTESLAIVEFLEDAYPSHAPHVLPADPVARARARVWTDIANKTVVPAWFRLVMATGDDAAAQAARREELYAGVRALMAEAAVDGPYFLGEQFSTVDVALAPFVARDFVLAAHRGYERAEAGERWVRYARALEERKSVRETFSDKDRVMKSYARYLSNEAQSEAAKAFRVGKAF